MKRYMSAGEADEALGMSKATLYAYVSRGLDSVLTLLTEGGLYYRGRDALE